MRLVNIFSALTGAVALVMLALLHHRYGAAADFDAVLMAALAQLSTAAAGLAIAGRAGRLNLLGIAMMLAGANIFAGVIYASAIHDTHPFSAFAPIGGGLLIASWVVLAFASPKP